jgi:hypothetical protein
MSRIAPPEELCSTPVSQGGESIQQAFCLDSVEESATHLR